MAGPSAAMQPLAAFKLGSFACMCMPGQMQKSGSLEELTLPSYRGDEPLQQNAEGFLQQNDEASHRHHETSDYADSDEDGESDCSDSAQQALDEALEGLQSERDIIPREFVVRSSELDFLAVLFQKLWPKIDSAIYKLVKESIEPSIQDSFVAFRQLQFTKFSLGQKLPNIGPIEIWLAPCERKDEDGRGLELHIGLRLQSDVQMELSFGHLTAGINSMLVEGKVVMSLDPLLHVSPIVGGVALYFLDPPKVQLTFGGLAHIADSALLTGVVSSTVNSVICRTAVLPNVIFTSLAGDETLVDSATLRDPKPIGVLRVKLNRASGLFDKNWSLAMNNVYIRLALSADEWESSVVYGTSDPSWASERHDFMVYDCTQTLFISVNQRGIMNVLGQELLGQAKPLTVKQTLKLSGKSISIYGASHDNSESNGRRCGRVSLDVEWLAITPEELHPDGCIVRIKVDEIYLPPCIKGTDSACISARIGDVESRTPIVRRVPEIPDDAGHLHSKTRSGYLASHVEIPIEHVLALTIDHKQLRAGFVEIRALGRSGEELGACSVRLNVLVETHGFALAWDNQGSPRRPFMQLCTGQRAAVRAEVLISLQGMKRLSPEAALRTMSTPAKASQGTPMVPVGVRSPFPASSSPFSPFSARSSCRKPSWWRPNSWQQFNLDEAAKRLTLCQNTVHSCGWVNELLKRMWPTIVQFIRMNMEDKYGRMTQKLQSKLPKMFANAFFSKFDLGCTPPVFGPISIADGRAEGCIDGFEGIDISVGMRLQSQADIVLHAGYNINLGMQKISLRGQLLMRLAPLLGESPLVGGVTFCFLDTPKLGLEFSDFAKFVDNTLLHGTGRQMVDSAIASTLVLPNVMAMEIGYEEQGVDRALLRQPKPLGVLRVTAVRARGLSGRCLRLFKSRQSNPFLRLSLADEEWVSPIVYDTCDPDWSWSTGGNAEEAQDESVRHNFLVFDLRQKLMAEVQHASRQHYRGKVDVLGRALPLTAREAVERSNEILQLFEPDYKDSIEQEDEEHVDEMVDQLDHNLLPAGTPATALPNVLQTALAWSKGSRHSRLSRALTMDGLAGELVLQREWLDFVPAAREASLKQDAWCLLRLKVDEAYIPAQFAENGAALHVRVGPTIEEMTSIIYAKTDQGAVFAPGRRLEFEMESILFLLLPTKELRNQILELELADKKLNPIGVHRLYLNQILSRPGLSKCWGNPGCPRMVFNRPKAAGADAEAEDPIRAEALRSEAEVDISILALMKGRRAFGPCATQEGDGSFYVD